MSAFVVMVPAVIGGPAFAAAVAVAGVAMGLKAISAATQEQASVCCEKGETVEVGLDSSHTMAETLEEGEVLPLEGNGFKVDFVKSPRGDCLMRVTGEGKSKADLEQLGRDLLNRVTQQYAYQKITTELKKKGFSLVKETVEEDQTIKITVRKWS